MKFGSHLYGLQTPDSDTDYKGVYLPTIDQLLLGNYEKVINLDTNKTGNKNSSRDVDEEYIALPQFIRQACKGETFAIDMLHCSEPIISSTIWEELVDNRCKFFSKNMKAYVGYVKQQAHKYGIKGSRLSELKSVIDDLEFEDFVGGGAVKIQDFPRDGSSGALYTGKYVNWVTKNNKHGGTDLFYEVLGKMYQSTNTVDYVLDRLRKTYDTYGERAKQAERNEGVDWKAISHALRAGYQAKHIYNKGDFSYPLPENDYIYKVKTGQLDFKDVEYVLTTLVDDVEKLSEGCNLQGYVDKAYWDEWLLDVYKKRWY